MLDYQSEMNTRKLSQSKKGKASICKIAKVVLVGSSSVGKTSIIKAFMNREAFHGKTQVTLPGEEYTQAIPSNKGPNESLMLHIWDSAGQDTFDSICSSYYRKADIAIIVCDANKADSLRQIHDWWEKVFNVANPPVVAIVANKCDTLGDNYGDLLVIKQFAKDHDALFRFVSAKQNIGIQELFFDVANLAQERCPDLKKRRRVFLAHHFSSMFSVPIGCRNGDAANPKYSNPTRKGFT